MCDENYLLTNCSLLGHGSRIGTKAIPPYRNNNHPKKVWRTMNDMRIRKFLCDVTLVADSVEIPAHKMVLASCSRYFYAMFNSCFVESKQERITLKEVDHQALVLLIEYAYTSEVTITEENVEALLSVANLLQFMDVRDACCEFLKAQLDPTNCLGIRAFAHIHGCLNLLVNSEDYIEQHFPEVVECDEFSNLTLRQVSKWISNDFIVTSEEKVFECVIAWVRHDLENRRHHLASLMEHVRLPLLSQHYLIHRVGMEPLFRVDPQCYHYFVEALKYKLLRGDEKRKARTPRTKPRRSPKVLLFSQKAFVDSAPSKTRAYKEFKSGREASEDLPRSGRSSKSNTEENVEIVKIIVLQNLSLREITSDLSISYGTAHCFRYFGHETTCVVRAQFSSKRASKDCLEMIWGQLPILETHHNWRWDMGLRLRPEYNLFSILSKLLLRSIRNMVAGVNESYNCSVECFDFKEERWYQVAEMPIGRWGLGLAVLNSKVYAVGGSSNGRVDVYDAVLDQWTSCANMNDHRFHLGVAVLDDLIYAVGGCDASEYLNTAEVFDTKTQSWKMISPMSTRRVNVGVGVLDDLLYAVGGYNTDSQCLSCVECYNPKTDTWLRVPDMLFRREGAGVGVLDGILYAVGGHDGSFPVKSVEAYDPEKKTWTPVADMAVCRRDAGVVAMNGLLYVVGGDDGHSRLSSVEVYNPEEDTWTMSPSCTSVVCSYGGVAIIDKSSMKATCC